MLSDGLSRVIRSRTPSSWEWPNFTIDQVNEHPNATFNGTFNIDGTETGSAYADFLLGNPSNYHPVVGPAVLSAQSVLTACLRAGQLASSAPT
jgi:hypothetical protein